MDNLKPHSNEINGDLMALMFSEYMKGEWGVETGYLLKPLYEVTMNKELLDWQWLSDCCLSCTTSKKPQPGIIVQYATLSTLPVVPFPPLFPGGFWAPCMYTGIGDFNNDFYYDFFK